jgi:hypothetical protein
MTITGKASPEQLLALLQAAIESAPAFEPQTPLSDEDVRWLGRVDALLDASGPVSASVSFRAARQRIGIHNIFSRNDLLVPLHDAFSRMELQVPSSMKGSFIAGGDTWNGYSALVRIMQSNCEKILVIDPYINLTLFTELAPIVKAKAGLRCLTVKRSENHPGLLAVAQKWARDSISAGISVEVRYTKDANLHDRLVIIDGREVWLVSQSMKDIAKRSPASISRAEPELGLMKAQHYEALWAQSDRLN